MPQRIKSFMGTPMFTALLCFIGYLAKDYVTSHVSLAVIESKVVECVAKQKMMDQTLDIAVAAISAHSATLESHETRIGTIEKKQVN